MPNYCSVPGCTEKGGHSFPIDAAMRLKWKVAIRRIDPETKKLWEPEFFSAFFKELFCLYRDSMKSLTIIHYTKKKKKRKKS